MRRLPRARRTLRRAAWLLAAGALVTACSSGGSTSDGSTADDSGSTATGSAAAGEDAAEAGAEDGGPWTFTDDRGETVELPERPTRIAGLTDVVSSLMNYGVEPVAAFGFTAIGDDPRFDGKDTSGIVELGRIYGEINMESLAAAQPDLIVTHAYPVDSEGTLDPDKPLYGFQDLTQQEAVADVAPVVAVSMSGSAADVIERTVDLAVALGVDADAEVLAEARADYEEAAERLTAAAEEGLQVLVAAAYPDEGLYVAKAPDDPALTSYADLGVDFVDPGGEEYYWEAVSWENVGGLPADLVLWSTRAMTGEEMLGQATFARTPAAQADQLYPWIFGGMDYVDQAGYMNRLAGWLEESEQVT